jgi:hypothetical protein
MHREGKCHITGWVKTKGGGSNQAIYTAGPGVDAPCKLKPKSHAKKCKQWRERCKKQGKPINNARDLKRKAASHGWAAALF